MKGRRQKAEGRVAKSMEVPRETLWGLWDRGKKEWRRSSTGGRRIFLTKALAQAFKVSVTQRRRGDPLIEYYRAFVIPRRIPK